MTCLLETERLRLREFTPSDAGFIIELMNSPGWIEFIGNTTVRTSEQAKTYLENGPITSYRENGFGLSMVELKESNAAIGMCGIIRRKGLDHPDIGFAFLPAFMGKGYAFEIASATMHYAKQQLKLTTISAITVPANVRSIKLLEKLGMKYVKTFCLPNSTTELLLYTT